MKAIKKPIEVQCYEVNRENFEYMTTKNDRHGWRYFECECGYMWMAPTRDYLSPSSEICRRDGCGETVYPYNGIADDKIEVKNDQ